MPSKSTGSVTRWIRDLKTGKGDYAIRLLYQRYFSQVVRLTKAKLRLPQGGINDGEDIALIALNAVCGEDCARVDFEKMQNRDDLWKLLWSITARRVASEWNYRRRVKHGAGRIVDEGALAARHGPGLDQIAGRETAPDFAAQMTEECCRLLDELDKVEEEFLREIALLKLDEQTNDTIAKELKVSKRTVERKLAVIREAWIGESKAPARR